MTEFGKAQMKEYEGRMMDQQEVCADTITEIEEALAGVRYFCANGNSKGASTSYDVALKHIKALKAELKRLEDVECGY